MKILHILDHSIPLHSGYTFRTRAILNHQRALSLQTCHLTSPKQGAITAEKETYDGLEFYRCPPLPGHWANLPVMKQLMILPYLKRRIKEVVAIEKPDVLHAHSPALNGVAAYQAARECGLPLVYEVRAFWEDAAVNLGRCSENSLRYRLTRAMESYVLKRADHVTCICEGLKQDISARGIPAERITTIPNAVDTHQFQRVTEKNDKIQALYQLQDCFVIGFIGSYYEYEGLDLLVRALDILKRSMPHLRLLLVGGGPQEAYLKQLASSLAIEDRILFVGRVPHSEVSQYYSVVDALVYPRKSMRLTDLVTPLKPMEAMAQGIPVLASDVGGHKELINHGSNGLLFTADSPPALATTLEQLVADPDLSKRIVEGGLHYVESERNWANSVGRYPAIYESLVKEPRYAV